MVLPAARDGKACAWPSFCFPGAGCTFPNSPGSAGRLPRPEPGLIGCTYRYIILFSHRPHTARWCWDIFPVTLWTPVTRWQGS